MRSGLLLAATALVIAFPGSTKAGPHLGMKLACKRYGDAWNTGSLNALRPVVTEDFYRRWARMPEDAFAQLPRGGSATVLSSAKTSRNGTVTVATRGGVMKLVLVGSGFNWKVDDILRSDGYGRQVSVKDYIDVSLTASEFVHDLKYRGGSSFHGSISRRFLGEFRRVAPDDLVRIRGMLPEIERQQPNVRIDGRRAEMQVAMPGGKRGDRIIFSLVKERGWKVDDYRVDAESVQIASFRNALPVLASVTALDSFTKSAGSVQLASFTRDGSVRQALLFASQQNPSPLSSGGVREKFEISKDLKTVCICQGGRELRLDMTGAGNRVVIDAINVKNGDGWMDVAAMLNLQRRVTQSRFANAFARLIGSDEQATTFASATEDDSETEERTKKQEKTTTIARKPKPSGEPTADPAVRSALAIEPVLKTLAPKLLPTGVQAIPTPMP